MQKAIIFFSSLVLLVGFVACKKSKVDPKNLTKTELVARTWICEQAEVKGASNQIIYKKGQSGNLLELKDSFVTFFTDGKYQGIDFNATPQTGSWRFKNNETVAELDNWDYEFEIVNLSNKNLDFNTKVEYNGKEYDIFVKMIAK